MNDNSSLSLDILQYVLTGWKRIAITSIVGLVAGLAYGFLAPKWYTSELSVVPTVLPKGGNGVLSGAVAALGVSDIPIDIGSSDVDRIVAIFHSTSVTDVVVAKFNLVARYRRRYLEDAREELWDHCSTKVDKKAGVVTLSCEDKSPEIARTLVAYFADHANLVARRISTSSAGDERRFLETRVSQARGDLDKASRSLREFQEQNRIISLPEQAKAVVTSMATLRAEMLEKQIQLGFVNSFSSNDESTSGQLRQQVGVLQAKLKSLEETNVPASLPAPAPSQGKRTTADSRNTGLFPPAMNIPILQYQLEQLIREQKMQETLMALLTQRYEIARVNEARDTSSFQILDQPVLPTKKSRPHGLRSALIGFVTGLGLAVAILYARRRLSNSS